MQKQALLAPFNPVGGILRIRQVIDRTGLSKSTLYEQINAGGFPKPIKLSRRTVGWIANEVDSWLLRQIAKSRGGVA